jgi:hypothetical protein
MALTYAYAMLRLSVAGKSSFRGIYSKFTYCYFRNFEFCFHIAWIPQNLFPTWPL